MWQRFADLVELTDDDRAALCGAFLTIAARPRRPDGAQALVLFRRKGKRAFETEQDEAVSK
ncbi:conjugal transfer protein TraD [Qipengyuania gelatinilytica]|uniref:Conjugal transfer protein TraD n=1 Tax=Qipengyuania gelatinilytica TaxID=2867231 RepID=A0ABX9A5G8_9SPHN|nr:conjugal transfer protein TraD [Qipengyuania gelatinilytica]QZD96551.1 conjugal transfer protein TraD [Qipengyuania gelatinilytica]